MKDTLKTKKMLTIAFVALVVSFALYGLLFMRIRMQNQEISVKANEVEQTTKQNETIRTITLALEKNEGDLLALDTYFIPKDGVVDFINTLDSLGRNSNTELTIGEVVSELDPRVKDDFKETLKFRINASGTIEDVFHLLSLLETLPVRLRVELASIGLSSASDKLLFSEVASSSARVPSAGEEWKLDANISVIKIR